MSYSARVLADSVSPAGVRLTTLEVTFPRIVLAEFNTHRMLSRNSASSRAIPVENRIAAVEADPFIPVAFGRNRRGMQAVEALEGADAAAAEETWMEACRIAVYRAKQLASLGVHKQLANRLLEPFLWHTVVVTATEWSNFFALRCNPDAQPEIRTAAELMRSARDSSEPRAVAAGEWHLPYLDAEENVDVLARHLAPALVSSARCARVSYLTQDGRRDPAEDLKLADRLLAAGHMSPFEHAARPLDRSRDVGRYDLGSSRPFVGNFAEWVQLRKTIRHEDDFAKVLAERGEAAS